MKQKRGIKLRSRVLLIMFAGILLLGLIVYGLQHLIILPSYEELESQEAENDMRHCIEALRNEATSLNMVTFEWSAWDDTYRFALDRNSDYIRNNLGPNTFITKGLSLLCIFDNEKNIVWGKYHDRVLENKNPQTKALYRSMAEAGTLMHESADSSKRGILITGGDAVILASRPILTSQYRTPIHGTLIMGRLMSKSYIRKIAGKIGVNFYIEAVLQGDTSNSTKQILKEIKKENPFFISYKSPSCLKIYTVYPDITGKPALLLAARIPRGISIRGAETADFLLICILTGGLMLIIALMAVLEKTIVKPVTKLTSDMVSIRQSDDFSLRSGLKRNDEIGVLSKEIDHLLQKVEEVHGGMSARIKEHSEKLDKTDKMLVFEKDLHMKAAQSLRRNQEFLRELFENSPFGIVMLDAENHVQSINHAFENMFQYSIDEIRGISIDTLIIPGGKDEEALDLTTRTFRGDSVYQEAVRKRKDGQLLNVRIHGLPIVLEKVRIGIYGIYIDISKEKKIQAERRRLEEQLMEAKKMEAVGTLAGGMAHEFNNLIATILGNVDLLLSTETGDPVQRRRMEGIKKSAGRTAKLTDQLLSFSRKQMLTLRIMDVNTLLTTNDYLIRNTCRDNVKIIIDLCSEPLNIKGDKTQLTQVLMDIVGNAGDAMPEGGTLTVKTTVSQAIQSNSFACISITDTGTGMDSKILEHIFEPFFTTKPPGKSTGLGLAFVYGTIKQHNGKLDVSSTPGKGTSFHIFLPLIGSDSQQDERDQVDKTGTTAITS